MKKPTGGIIRRLLNSIMALSLTYLFIGSCIALGAHPARMSLDIQNGDVRQVLALIGREMGINIVASEAVKGQVTVVMNNVPAAEVLQSIFQQRGLVGKQDDGILIVRPKSEAIEQERLGMELVQQAQSMGPLKQEAFHLRFAQAIDLEKLVREQLTARGKVSVDSRTNTVFVNDTALKLSEIAHC